MPMSGSNYVAPTWVDKAPPALDAAELQAMCNTIQENQENLDAIIPLVNTISGKAQAQIVSYVGTGTYGESNPCSITANFPIKCAFLISILEDDPEGYNVPFNGRTSITSVSVLSLIGTFVRGAGFCYSNLGLEYCKRSLDSKTVTWYTNSSDGGESQLNKSGNKYYFLCIG